MGASAAFALLVAGHFAGFTWPKRWYDREANPRATVCYDEMFAEPLSVFANLGRRNKHGYGRPRPLISRWGNTLSNGLYLAGGLCVVQQSTITVTTTSAYPFRWADGLFGCNLLLLAFFSTLWHGANYNKEHYLDLWAMDHAILYLIFRFVAPACEPERSASCP